MSHSKHDKHAGLSTHVLDTANGRPAVGVRVDVYRIDGDRRARVNSTVTDENGRVAALLPAGKPLSAGVFELDFAVGEYFAHQGVAKADPAFLGVVTVRFGVYDSSAHHHVPLLVSPFGYSTYRGS
jgi:5-hydroxyisourate hydrolase